MASRAAVRFKIKQVQLATTRPPHSQGWWPWCFVPYVPPRVTATMNLERRAANSRWAPLCTWEYTPTSVLLKCQFYFKPCENFHFNVTFFSNVACYGCCRFCGMHTEPRFNFTSLLHPPPQSGPQEPRNQCLHSGKKASCGGGEGRHSKPGRNTLFI